jgi:uncharacterized damage-inducible protein DinB
MDTTAEALLESWRRQTEIIDRLVAALSEDDFALTPAEGETTVDFHIRHIHEVRSYWLSQLGVPLAQDADPGDLRSQLRQSADAVGGAVTQLLEQGATRVAPYDHPVLFLQHMMWHEGWHAGIIVLSLRRAGRELSEEWEERNMWGIWRDPEV